MGGSVDVKSEIGKGSEFIINIKTKCKVKNLQFNDDMHIIDIQDDNFSGNVFGSN